MRWERQLPHAPVDVDTNIDGYIAVSGAEGGCWVIDPADGAVLGSSELPGGSLSAAFSPDGRLIALTGPTGYVIVRIGDGTILQAELTGWSAAAAWCGDRLAVAAGRRLIILAPTDPGAGGTSSSPTLTTSLRTDELPSTVTGLAWTRRGRTLLASAYGGVYAFERHSSSPVRTYAYPGSHLALAVPADERWVTTGNQDRSVHIWRARDGDELEMGGYPGKVSRLAFDETGRWLAVDGAPDITVWDFSGKGPAGSRPRELSAHRAVSALAWRPGTAGELASYGSEGRLALWHTAGTKPRKTLLPQAVRALGPSSAILHWQSPSALVVCTRDGKVTLLDL